MWFEGVRVAKVRSKTTKHKFSTLPIALYERETPKSVDFDFLIAFLLPHKGKLILFCKGTVFHKNTEEDEILIVAKQDVSDAKTAISAEDRDNSLHLS